MSITLNGFKKSLNSLFGEQTTLNSLIDKKRTRHIRDYQDELVKVIGVITELDKLRAKLTKYKNSLENKISKARTFANNNKLLTEY